MLPVIRASAVHRLQRDLAAERPSSAFENEMFEMPRRAALERARLETPWLHEQPWQKQQRREQ